MLACVGAGLLALPMVVGSYALSVLILALFVAYSGQAWNVAMGFCGQLSLGHALYVGLGAYTSAALFAKAGVPPAIGLVPAALVAAAAGAVLGFLAFRFAVSGVYFAILTVAFAEFTRIGFDHWGWLGGTGGLFLPVAQRGVNDLANLRGAPVMFYYLLLLLNAGALVACRALLRSRLGYSWLAIRENPEAAEASGVDVFRCKMAAITVSAGMTGLAGVLYAFYYNALFPEQVFGVARSVEIILAPIVGGLGTLVGPVLGAVVMTLLGEGITNLLSAAGLEVPGAKQVFYGVCLGAVILALPHGIWPPLARRLGLRRGAADGDGQGGGAAP